MLHCGMDKKRSSRSSYAEAWSSAARATKGEPDEKGASIIRVWS